MTETQKHQERYAFIKDRVSCGMWHVACVLVDGTVKATGNNIYKQCDLQNWSDVIKVKCGAARTVGLRKDGTVLSTYEKIFDEEGASWVGGTEFVDIIDIACGLFHNVGLKSNGTVVVYGINDCGQCDVADWKNVKKIYAETQHTIAVCHDGSLLYCGENDNGAINLAGMSNVKELYCGPNDTVIVTKDNKVYRTDAASLTPVQLNLSGNDIAEISFAEDYYLILKSDGTVLHFGNKEKNQNQVGEWRDILGVSCAEKSAAGFSRNYLYDTSKPFLDIDFMNVVGYIRNVFFSVWVNAKGIASITYNKDGKLEVEEFQIFKAEVTDPSKTEEKATPKTTYQQQNSPHKKGIAWEHKQKYGYLINRLAGGIGHSVGVIYDGTVEACGGNGLGQCDVDYWSDVTAVACTAGATLGLRKDGTVLYTGKIPFNTDNCSAYGTHPSKWTNVKAIAGCLHSTDHAVGLLTDGKVVAFGCNEDGQCNVTNWCDIIEISVQPALTAGVRKDGTVVVCGKDAAIKSIVAKWTNIEHLYKGVGEQSLIGLKYDGTVVSTENDKTFDMSNWRGIIDISVGMTCIAGLTGNGHLYFTGKVPQDMLVEGINGVLCVNADLDAILAAKNDHTTDMIVMNKGVANKTNVNGGSLGFQTGMAHKMIIQECGEVLTQILFEQMECGQDDTEDWALTKPVDEPNGGNAPTNGGGGNAPVQTAKGGCYVATCVYGSYDCPQVWTLRRYRDETLGSTWYGRLFIRTYYAISPTFVKWFGNTAWFKKLWRGKLDRMVSKLQANGVEDTPYKDKNW